MISGDARIAYADVTPPLPRAGSPLEVLAVFFKLGVSCFGGPIAHIGYFREEFVVRRRWLDEQAFVDLVALCQFLPGPASSQTGFSIGLMRAGYCGGLAAWTGFTLPSAMVMVLFAYGAGTLHGTVGTGLLHGLKLVAVAIVAQAVWGMARALCPDKERASIAVVAALIVLVSTSSVAQIGAILFGGIIGLWLCRGAPPAAAGHLTIPVSRTTGLVALTAFFGLLVGLPIAQSFTAWPGISLFEAFYRSGALVFGGGHVVLPLLREAFVAPGWVSDNSFLAGYGAAQAVPGPLFTFAAYLGAVVNVSPHGLPGAAIGLIGIFPSRDSDPPCRAAVLGFVAETSRRASDHARRQRRGCGSARRGALRPDLDEFGNRAGRLRHRIGRFRSLGRVARAAVLGCPHIRMRRNGSGADQKLTVERGVRSDNR
jgi:chromate transporter